ncbi:Uma2 family endonuclease [Streptomyces sp. NPDC021749]|uniref:Uma2 family endonuclease n=1 Tax=Streptomyces sp. NPDC021749 TaxID=3154905 RepID=UPI0033E31B71
MSAAPEFELDEQYNYPVPPPGGWTADDLDRLPDLPPHTELIDGVVFRQEGITDDANQTWYRPEDVVLAVEVVSPDSEARDRDVKPRKYAAAGVPHFWRVEKSSGLPVVYVYELDPATGAYTPTGIYHDRIKVPVPFPIDIDLTAINKRR